MNSAISDRALDLGIFALDNELAGVRDISEPMHYETFKQPVVEQLNCARQPDDDRELTAA
jgi:hypothetical protein